MPLKYVEGDLFAGIYEPKEHMTLIAHVCNDLGVMGAGFVVPLGKTFPLARQAYLEDMKANKYGLGDTQFVTVVPDEECGGITVCNMVAQHGIGGKRPLRYNSLSKCMDAVAKFAREDFPDSKIICPAFGSGLAGGDWSFIEHLIQDCWLDAGIDVTVFYLPNNAPMEIACKFPTADQVLNAAEWLLENEEAPEPMRSHCGLVASWLEKLSYRLK